MSASAATSTSPPASGITARQLTPAQCAFAEDEPHYWCGDSAADTEYFHAYSVLFPEGENFFVRAVLAYNRHPAVEGNPALRDAVKGFVSQEIHHAAAHIRYNKIVAGRFNHDMEGVSRFTKSLLSIPETVHIVSSTHRNSLGITCSLEHLTALLGELLLNTDAGLQLLTMMAPSHRAMWIYHAIEETEHKAVAFDVYKATCESYTHRVWTHMLATVLFFIVSTVIYLMFMWDGGRLFYIQDHLRLVGTLFVSPGLWRGALPLWTEYLDRDFNPSNRPTLFIQPWAAVIQKGTVVTDQDLQWIKLQKHGAAIQ